MPKQVNKILILRTGLSREPEQWTLALQREGLRSYFCLSLSELKRRFEEGEAVAAVTTHKPPGLDATTTVASLRSVESEIPILVVLHDSEDDCKALSEAGATRIVSADESLEQCASWLCEQMPASAKQEKPVGFLAAIKQLWRGKRTVTGTKRRALRESLPSAPSSQHKKDDSPVVFGDSFTPLRSEKPSVPQRRDPPKPIATSEPKDSRSPQTLGPDVSARQGPGLTPEKASPSKSSPDKVRTPAQRSGRSSHQETAREAPSKPNPPDNLQRDKAEAIRHKMNPLPPPEQAAETQTQNIPQKSSAPQEPALKPPSPLRSDSSEKSPAASFESRSPQTQGPGAAPQKQQDPTLDTRIGRPEKTRLTSFRAAFLSPKSITREATPRPTLPEDTHRKEAGDIEHILNPLPPLEKHAQTQSQHTPQEAPSPQNPHSRPPARTQESSCEKSPASPLSEQSKPLTASAESFSGKDLPQQQETLTSPDPAPALDQVNQGAFFQQDETFRPPPACSQAEQYTGRHPASRPLHAPDQPSRATENTLADTALDAQALISSIELLVEDYLSLKHPLQASPEPNTLLNQMQQDIADEREGVAMHWGMPIARAIMRTQGIPVNERGVQPPINAEPTTRTPEEAAPVAELRQTLKEPTTGDLQYLLDPSAHTHPIHALSASLSLPQTYDNLAISALQMADDRTSHVYGYVTTATPQTQLANHKPETPQTERIDMLDKVFRKLKPGEGTPERPADNTPGKRLASLPLIRKHKGAESPARAADKTPMARSPKERAVQPETREASVQPERVHWALSKPRSPLNAPSRITPIAPSEDPLQRMGHGERSIPEGNLPDEEDAAADTTQQVAASPFAEFVGESVEFEGGFVATITELREGRFKLEADDYEEWIPAEELCQ